MNENNSPFLPNQNQILPNELNPPFPIPTQNPNIPLSRLNNLTNLNQISINNPLSNSINSNVSSMNSQLGIAPIPSINNLQNMQSLNNIQLSSQMQSQLNHQVSSQMNLNQNISQYPMNQIQSKDDKSLESDNGFSLTYNHKLPHEERQLLDGSTKNVGIVIKQSSFLVIIVSQRYPLDNCSVDCSLIYDNAELSEAHYINQKPISFNSQVNNNNTMNVELRISVLSSSHEDMLFRVRFDIYNSMKEKIATLYSGPLRVISKADSSKKKSKQAQQTAKTSQSLQPSQKTKSPRMPNCFKKENKTGKDQKEKQPKDQQEIDKENILQTLQYQQNLLKEISQHTSVNPLTQPLVVTLNYYLAMPQTQRINQLMQFIAELTPQESMIITELMEIFRSYKKN